MRATIILEKYVSSEHKKAIKLLLNSLKDVKIESEKLIQEDTHIEINAPNSLHDVFDDMDLCGYCTTVIKE